MKKEDNLVEEYMKKWILDIDKKLDNHLVHVAADISQIKNDVDWIKKIVWAVLGTSIAAIVSAFFSLIIK